MAQSMSELEQEALQLSAEDRARLAASLLCSLEATGENPEEVEKLWISEATRRAKEIQENPGILIPAADVFARLKAKYDRK